MTLQTSKGLLKFTSKTQIVHLNAVKLFLVANDCNKTLEIENTKKYVGGC
jgi:hypothetical protein